MGPFASSLGRRLGATAPRRIGSLFFRQMAKRSSESSSVVEHPLAGKTPPSRERTVAVFWDLDNKPPKGVPPFQAAVRLKEMAGEFGEVVDVVAYANHHAFSHVPSWVHEERRQRKVLDLLESSGEVRPEQPYICGVCGAKKKTHVLLTKHFKMLHEREQKKRLNRLDALKVKKRQKERFWDNNVEKISKYRDAARTIIVPAEGYGLMQEIRRAGVFVRTVKDEPQAADIALKDHMMRSIKRGVNCICLVSDDGDFKSELRMARERRLQTVVLGDLRILNAYADAYFSWAEVASGRFGTKAKLAQGQEMGDVGNAALRSELDEEGGGPTERLEFDPHEISEEDSESDFGSDSDEERLWQPVERSGDAEKDRDFDTFSDGASESDSESQREPVAPGARHILNWLTDSKFGRAGKVPTGSRGFRTEREVVPDSLSLNEGLRGNGDGATVHESDAQKPEKLHNFFTMLESANKGHPLTSKDKIDVVEEGRNQHFRRVESILRTPSSEKVGKQVSEKYVEKGHHIEMVQYGLLSAEREKRVETREKNIRTRDEDHIDHMERLQHGLVSSESEKHVETQDVSRKPEVLTSSVCAEDSDDESYKQRKRTRIRKSISRRSRIIKVVSEGPPPFYISGFASESQADCDAVDHFYASFWNEEEEVYRGKQDRRRKT